MKSSRKAVPAVIALATLGLAACGSSGTSASAGGRTTIVVDDQNSAANTPAFQQLIDRFNSSQSTYTVKRQFVAGGGSQFTPSIINAIKGGQAPNVVFADSDPASMSQIVDTGKVVPLNDLLATGTTPLTRSDFSKPMLDAATFDGKLYALPTEGGDYAVIYNKQMFTAAGITSTPKTWNELAADAQKLTTKGTYGMYLPLGSGEWPPFVYEAMLASAGGQLLNTSHTKAAFDSPAGVTALTDWTNMITAKTAYPNSLATATDSQGEPGFDAKKFAMFVGEVYNIKSTSAALGAANVGVFPLPAVNTPSMVLGENVSFMLSGTAAQQAGSWAFLSWLHQPAQQAPWAAATGYLPANVKAESQPAWQDYVAKNPLVNVFANELPYAITRPSIDSYAEISNDLNTAINSAMAGKQSPQQALAAAAAQANTALKG